MERATLQVSVNGGAPQRGGVTVAYGDTIVASLQDPSGVQRAEYRLWEYPEGFECPAGWNELPSGHGYFVITNGGPAPAFTLPGAETELWGKYFLSVEVNGRRRNNTVAPELYDESTALKIPDPNGFEDVGFMESTQFDSKRGWAGELKKATRAASSLLGNVTGGSGVFANDGFSLKVAPQHVATLSSIADSGDDSTAATLGSDGIYLFTVLATATGSGGSYLVAYKVRGRLSSGTLTLGTPVPIEDDDTGDIDLSFADDSGALEVTVSNTSGVTVNALVAVGWLFCPVPAAP